LVGDFRSKEEEELIGPNAHFMEVAMNDLHPSRFMMTPVHIIALDVKNQAMQFIV
jgi:hypothetical protein